MREIWRELFGDVVVATSKVVFGNDAANSVLLNIVEQAMLAQCIDQKIRKAIQSAVSSALADEHHA